MDVELPPVTVGDLKLLIAEQAITIDRLRRALDDALALIAAQSDTPSSPVTHIGD